ncbi:MAG: flagellar hook-length control protein FliK [Gammaproteobacteria bacterium]|nr:flagellar hook-length control protein FliK [Gammaproteobacteria bacterium]
MPDVAAKPTVATAATATDSSQAAAVPTSSLGEERRANAAKVEVKTESVVVNPQGESAAAVKIAMDAADQEDLPQDATVTVNRETLAKPAAVNGVADDLAKATLRQSGGEAASVGRTSTLTQGGAAQSGGSGQESSGQSGKGSEAQQAFIEGMQSLNQKQGREAAMSDISQRNPLFAATLNAMSQGEAVNSQPVAATAVTTAAAAPLATLTPITAAVSAAGLAAASAPASSTLMSLDIPLRQQGWDRALGERMIWMMRNTVQEAKLQLNPRELGPVEVKLSVSPDQQASVSFVANNAVAREALEAAMPRLREMFNQAGLNLSQSDVSERQSGDQRAAEGGQQQGSGRGGRGSKDAAEHGESGEVRQHQYYGGTTARGVDFFA